MNRKLAVALASGAALVFTLSGCGGDDNNGEETEAWARSICSQLGPQAEQIRSANDAITEVSRGDQAPKEVQETYSTAFRDISDAYAALADAVDEAGNPPVDDGARLRREAVRELRGNSDAYGELKDTVDGLDTSNQGEFGQGLRGVAGELNELLESGDESLSALEDGELGEALAQQEGCQSPPAQPGQGEEGAAGDEGAEESQDGQDGRDGTADEEPEESGEPSADE